MMWLIECGSRVSYEFEYLAKLMYSNKNTTIHLYQNIQIIDIGGIIF